MRVHKLGDDPLYPEPQLPGLTWGPSSEAPWSGAQGIRSGGPRSLSKALRILPGTDSAPRLHSKPGPSTCPSPLGAAGISQAGLPTQQSTGPPLPTPNQQGEHRPLP